ncbi:MAG: TIGR04219 family outer membrane beta-barrel protein [Colwellia sp.]|nr:TIGR04219 family outer membrane beta-barrel protein [Colwellia sp.]
MKKTVFAVTLAALLTANIQANTVGLYLGGQIWQSEASGIFGEKNTLIDFNLKKEQQNNYFVAVEHPFPLLPNVLISSTTLNTTGKTNLTQGFSFDDKTFLIDDDVNASFNVSYVDYTLYYELFDKGVFSFDLGLTARDFNGGVTVTGITEIVTTIVEEDNVDHTHLIEEISSSVTTGKIKTDEIVPMLYVATNITLSLTGLSVFAQGNFLLIDHHSLYDYQVGLSYDLVDSIMVDFNLTLGYRAVKMEFEDLENLYTDLEFKGAFVGVIVHF